MKVCILGKRVKRGTTSAISGLVTELIELIEGCVIPISTYLHLQEFRVCLAKALDSRRWEEMLKM